MTAENNNKLIIIDGMVWIRELFFCGCYFFVVTWGFSCI